MIAPKSMGHVAMLQGSIGYACGPVLMIHPRVKGLVWFLSNSPDRQPDAD
jgi:hypothetical protein